MAFHIFAKSWQWFWHEDMRRLRLCEGGQPRTVPLARTRVSTGLLDDRGARLPCSHRHDMHRRGPPTAERESVIRLSAGRAVCDPGRVLQVRAMEDSSHSTRGAVSVVALRRLPATEPL